MLIELQGKEGRGSLIGRPARWRDLTEVRRETRVRVMDEITLQIQHDEESGWLVASWDSPDGSGGITTQGQDLRDLQHQVTEAVAAYFDEGAAPRRILNALR
jgi:hypothetical protein